MTNFGKYAISDCPFILCFIVGYCGFPERKSRLQLPYQWHMIPKMQ